MNLNEKRLSGETIYAGRILTLEVDRVELPNGRQSTREVIRHPGGACVAALTDKDELLFVRQFRYPYGRVLWELPAGKLSPGEDPVLCAARELSEETGVSAAKWCSLGALYPSVGYTDEVLHLYAATVRMAEAGELPDAKTQALVLRVALLRQKGEI